MNIVNIYFLRNYQNFLLIKITRITESKEKNSMIILIYIHSIHIKK